MVILGPTGRNFAAGMSGGVAYVYDPDGTLADNLNAEMVELEDARRRGLSTWLRGIDRTPIVDATDSAVGQRILADWSQQVKHFVKVMPRDYKRVLRGDRRGRDATASTWTRRSWRPHVADPQRLSEAHPSRDPAAPAGAAAPAWTGKRSTRTSTTTRCSTRPAVAWTAVSRSATTAVRWGT